MTEDELRRTLTAAKLEAALLRHGVEPDVADVYAAKHAASVVVGADGLPDATSLDTVARNAVAALPAKFRRTPEPPTSLTGLKPLLDSLQAKTPAEAAAEIQRRARVGAPRAGSAMQRAKQKLAGTYKPDKAE